MLANTDIVIHTLIEVEAENASLRQELAFAYEQIENLQQDLSDIIYDSTMEDL